MQQNPRTVGELVLMVRVATFAAVGLGHQHLVAAGVTLGKVGSRMVSGLKSKTASGV